MPARSKRPNPDEACDLLLLAGEEMDKENGYEETILGDQFGDGSTTSVSDCGKFLESVYKKCEEEAGNSESENISDKMMADLRNQKKSGKTASDSETCYLCSNESDLFKPRYQKSM